MCLQSSLAFPRCSKITGLLLSNGAMEAAGHARLPGWGKIVIICLVMFMAWWVLQRKGIWGGSEAPPSESDFSLTNG